MEDYTYEQTASLAKALGKQLEADEQLRQLHTRFIASAAAGRRI